MKIKAFTLVELLLVLILTGLAVGIVSFVYFNLSAFGQQFHASTYRAQELALFDSRVRKDFLMADTVRYDPDFEILLLKRKGVNQPILWEFSDPVSIRKQVSVDSFSINVVNCNSIQHLEKQWLGLTITSGDGLDTLQFFSWK